MFNQGSIQTVENRIRRLIPTLFEVDKADSRFKPYRWDFRGYCKDILNSKPWAMQLEIADAYILALRQQHERMAFENGELLENDLEYWRPGQIIQNWLAIDAGHTSGKCVAASEYITLANGKRIKAGQLIGKSFELPTLKDGQVVPAMAKAKFNTIESVYKIITSTGKEIVRNFKHPLWVADAIFEGGKRPQITSVGWQSLGEIKAGQLVGVTDMLSVFGQEATLGDDEIKTLAYLIGDGGYTRRGVVFSQQKNKQLEELILCVNRLGCTVKYRSQYDYAIVGPGKNKKNPVMELLRAHGLMGKHSRDKFIPAEIFIQPEDKIKMFLSRLFSTDGWASLSKTGSKEIGFCSASEQLVRDIQELLVRLGIHSKVYSKNKVNAWILTIVNAENIVAFCEAISIYGKEHAQASVYELCRLTVDKKRANWIKRPDRPPWRYKNCLPGTIWEKVVSVERVGIEPTVAIEVPNYHAYLTMFYEHNTYLLAKLVSHFFDCFTPSIVYCFAPTSEQINDLLFKEIRVDRRGRDLPGFVFPRDTRIKYKADHFVTGRATNNANSTGTERIHGQHGKYLLFILDESEGIPDYVWDSVLSMTSGGITIVVSARNPRTTTCRAHTVRSLPKTAAFRISCLDVPNVVESREIVPNLARRDYIMDMLEYTEEVDEHNHEQYTFELPWVPEVIYKPGSEFLWRVLGIASEQLVDNTFCSYGRYDAAVERGQARPFEFDDMDDKATFGVDAARFGSDFAPVYIKRGDWLWRSVNFQTSDSFTVYHHIIEQMEAMVLDGVVHIEVRVDAGGGWGAGVIDLFRYDLELQYRHVEDIEDLKELLEFATSKKQVQSIQRQIKQRQGPGYVNKWQDLVEFQIYEVNFNGAAVKPRDFLNTVTEMYWYLGQQMKALCLRSPARALRVDVCERPYTYGMNGGYSVKVLLGKEAIKKKYHRSTDDGDGAALAAAPSHMFKSRAIMLYAG